jgi:acyl-CoA oxidase
VSLCLIRSAQEFHRFAFSIQETTLASAAKRIKKLIGSGLDPYDAFNIVQHQMIDVAQAYLERVVLEQFQETTEH